MMSDKPQMNQTEALAFTKKYLESKREGDWRSSSFEKTYNSIYNVVMKDVLENVIPRLYGEVESE